MGAAAAIPRQSDLRIHRPVRLGGNEGKPADIDGCGVDDGPEGGGPGAVQIHVNEDCVGPLPASVVLVSHHDLPVRADGDIAEITARTRNELTAVEKSDGA